MACPNCGMGKMRRVDDKLWALILSNNYEVIILFCPFCGVNLDQPEQENVEVNLCQDCKWMMQTLPPYINQFAKGIPEWRYKISEPMCNHPEAGHCLTDDRPLWTTRECRSNACICYCGSRARWFKPRKGHPKPIPTDKPRTLSYQIGGDHYKKMKIEVWEIIDAHPQLTHCEASALKYILREKEGEDRVTALRKAIHHLEHQVELEERGKK